MNSILLGVVGLSVVLAPDGIAALDQGFNRSGLGVFDCAQETWLEVGLT